MPLPHTAIGSSALRGKGVGDFAESGYFNTAIGSGNLMNIVTGSYNTVIGGNSFNRFEKGNHNIVLGNNVANGIILENTNNNI